MSFSSQAKTEICREFPAKKCCAVAESYGILLYANTFSASLIRVITESDALCARLPKLFRRVFGASFDVVPGEGKTGKRSFRITDPEKIGRIFAAFGYDPARTVSHHINLGMLEGDCDKVAFLRGAFLAGGSVTDPSRRYHLELVTGHASVCREVHALLLEMGFDPHDSRRGANSITYFKKRSAIEDILTTMGAPVSAMEIMQTSVEKDMANAMNRLTNCDMANADKVTDAAFAQLEAIRSIERGPGLDTLPPVLQDTALLRIANPSCSLSDLAQLASPPVTKSCMNHRLRKLLEYAVPLREES